LLGGPDELAARRSQQGGATPDPTDERCWLNDFVITDDRPDASDDGSLLDVAWTLWIDRKVGAELVKTRDAQIVQLGRYGHQDMSRWDGVDLQEFSRRYGALVDLLNQESALQRASET
jgi:hypothetical protein